MVRPQERRLVVHQHTEIRDLSVKLLFVSTVLLTFQGIFAYLTGSLVLLTDTAHLAGDNLVIIIAILTQVIVGHDCSEEKETETYHSLELQMTLVVGSLLLLGGGFLLYEAVVRLQDPPHISPTILIPGVVGLGGNLALIYLAQASGQHLTVKGMVAHFKADSFGSIGVIITGVLLWATGQEIFDPLISLLIVTQTFRLGLGLVTATLLQTKRHQ